MAQILDAYLFLAAFVFVYMTFWYVISLLFRRADVADIAWWLWFLWVVISSFLLNWIAFDVWFLATCLVSVWALRLSFHIFLRNKWKTEDYRYKNWRDMWWRWFFLRSFFQIFILQGFLLLLISSPVVVINVFRPSFWLAGLLWIILWIIGFLFETVGDYQLSVFKKDPFNKGKLLQSGLWSITRHPNYFGEVLQWWALWFFTLSTSYFLFGLIGPITITVLILFVSGIPMLERKMSSHPDFALYAQKTNKFFPGFSSIFFLRKNWK